MFSKIAKSEIGKSNGETYYTLFKITKQTIKNEKGWYMFCHWIHLIFCSFRKHMPNYDFSLFSF